MPVIWRDAVHADLPRLEELWAEQQVRFKERAPTVHAAMPELFYPEEETHHAFYPFKPPVLRVRVAEQDGVILAARIVEAVCEVQLIGGNEDVVRSLGRELPEECQWARSKGFRSGWGLAPKELAKPIERSLRHTPLRPWPNLVLIGCDFQELGD
jgi:hypothetical protein